MCGISGYFGRRQITSDVINGTLNLMKNRGPNFSNHYNKKFESGLSIYLLHTRLSIIDLNERSNQPFIDENYILIFKRYFLMYLTIKKFIFFI